MLGKIKKETCGLEKCYRKTHFIFKKVSSTFNITKLSEFVKKIRKRPSEVVFF